MENPTAGHSAENILMEHPDDHLQMQTPMVNEQQENDITSDESPSRCQDIVKAKCRDTYDDYVSSFKLEPDDAEQRLISSAADTK